MKHLPGPRSNLAQSMSLTLLLIVMVAVSACGSSGTQSKVSGSSTALNCHGCGDGKTIRVWTEAVGTTQQQDEWQDYVGKQFEQATGAKVEFTIMTTGTEVLNAIEAGATTGTGPDVLDTANSYNGNAESAHIYNSISKQDWALLGGKAKFSPGVLQSQFTGGNTVDWYLHTDLLAYNTKLFKQAGIAAPPTTWSEYVQDAAKISALGNGTYGAPFSAGDPYDPWHELYTLTRDYGGNFVNPTTKQATMMSTPVVNAVQFWLSWYTKKLASPQSLTWTGTQTQALFLEGKLGMENQVNQAVITAAQGTPLEGNLAFAPMPTIPAGAKSLPKGAPPHGVVGFDFAYTLGVPKWSQNPSLAYRFLRVATDQQAEVKLYQLTAALPTTIAAGKVVGQDKEVAPFIKYEGDSIVAPSYPYWGAVENALAAMTGTLARDIENGTYGRSSLMSALKTANQQIQSAIDSSQ